MHRPLAAACAACLTTVITYPLDSIKLSKQTGISINEKYRGCLLGATTKFVSTGLYFTVYENFLHNVAFAAFTGLACANMVSVPIDFIRKNRQARLHTKATINTLPKLYFINMINNFPKNYFKYKLYEYYRLIFINFPPPVYGFLSAILSSAITSILLYPVDVLKTRIILKDNNYTKLSYMTGMKEGVILTVSNNAIGHTLLELWGPRI